MSAQGVSEVICTAILVVNRLTDEIETLFQELARLAGEERPRGWAVSRTYHREVEAGPHGVDRRLPQTLYRIFLPGVPPGSSRSAGKAGGEEDDEAVHLVVKPDTSVLVVAVTLYSQKAERADPLLIAALLEDLKPEKWKGAKVRGGAGLRRKHLKAVVERLELNEVEGPVVVEPTGVNGGRLGCRVRLLLRRPLTSIGGGADIARAWGEIVGALG